LRQRRAANPDLVLGVRPEILILPRQNSPLPPNAVTVPMKVWLVQPLGATMDVYLSTTSHERIAAHVDATAGLGVGTTLPIAIDMDRVHFFEPGEMGLAVVQREIPPV
jgi:multiple sugar transport system ATP-binding protein